ncbi:hypothetical protein AMAG_01628 [Allomyces macrogynus ATCC 38327]|uniref:SUN domain-containing protein n=1 Tax=Allomyces macrogynus (strain ATCC 38327) TaxID=578462 RepID=A0A0L0S057_ALLM3|nr:hypothetical protein AMAG_01628 [Allomyces macrogynus ATCC 38327]|eukprot:KNE55751.1 hypothetical protein AMAG_01628 [Allomyces macrogynus ATCC 38327]
MNGSDPATRRAPLVAMSGNRNEPAQSAPAAALLPALAKLKNSSRPPSGPGTPLRAMKSTLDQNFASPRWHQSGVGPNLQDDRLPRRAGALDLFSILHKPVQPVPPPAASSSSAAASADVARPRPATSTASSRTDLAPPVSGIGMPPRAPRRRPPRAESVPEVADEPLAVPAADQRTGRSPRSQYQKLYPDLSTEPVDPHNDEFPPISPEDEYEGDEDGDDGEFVLVDDTDTSFLDDEISGGPAMVDAATSYSLLATPAMCDSGPLRFRADMTISDSALASPKSPSASTSSSSGLLDPPLAPTWQEPSIAPRRSSPYNLRSRTQPRGRATPGFVARAGQLVGNVALLAWFMAIDGVIFAHSSATKAVKQSVETARQHVGWIALFFLLAAVIAALPNFDPSAFEIDESAELGQILDRVDGITNHAHNLSGQVHSALGAAGAWAEKLIADPVPDTPTVEIPDVRPVEDDTTSPTTSLQSLVREANCSAARAHTHAHRVVALSITRRAVAALQDQTKSLIAHLELLPTRLEPELPASDDSVSDLPAADPPLVDYAAAVFGARAVSEESSATYQFPSSRGFLGSWFSTSGFPRSVALHPSLDAGQCWATRAPAPAADISLAPRVLDLADLATLPRLTVHLARPVRPASIAIAHALDASTASAPRAFRVYGRVVDPATPAAGAHVVPGPLVPPPAADRQGLRVLLASGTYSVDKGMPDVQVFPVDADAPLLDRVTVVVDSHHGHDKYVCLYRVGVLAVPPHAERAARD